MPTHTMQMPGGQHGHIPSLGPALLHRCPRCVSGSLVVTMAEWKCINCSHVVEDVSLPVKRIPRAPLIEFEPGKELSYRTGLLLDRVCDMYESGDDFETIRAQFPRRSPYYVRKMIDYAVRLLGNQKRS
jgi:hypothetical protein